MFDLTTYLVKERVGLLKITDTYDIFNPSNGEQIAIAKEEIPTWSKLARLIIHKRMLPTSVNIYEGDEKSHGGTPLLSICRKGAFLWPKVQILGEDGSLLGTFKTKRFSWTGGFWVHDSRDQQIAEVKGDWKGWNFRFLTAKGQEIGTVTKKWAGLGKEFFTSADNYVISVNDSVQSQPAVVLLLLAAGLAIDTVFKEQQ